MYNTYKFMYFVQYGKILQLCAGYIYHLNVRTMWIFTSDYSCLTKKPKSYSLLFKTQGALRNLKILSSWNFLSKVTNQCSTHDTSYWYSIYVCPFGNFRISLNRGSIQWYRYPVFRIRIRIFWASRIRIR
jgi:hypothetical protein